MDVKKQAESAALLYANANKVLVGCSNFVGGVSAEINADGGSGSPYTDGTGAGGRVSIAIGVSDGDYDALGAGETPENLIYSDKINSVTATATGPNSTYNSTTGVWNKAPDGTLTTVLGEVSTFDFSVVSEPAGVIAQGVAYETVQVDKNSQVVRTAPAYGFDSADSRTRYSRLGWVVSNAFEEVASGDGATASFKAEAGPFTLVWLWGNPETATALTVPSNCTVRVDGGETLGEGVHSIWRTTGTVRLEAQPAEGCEFLCWEGEVGYGKSAVSDYTFDAGMRSLMPVVRPVEPATNRTWVGGTGVWRDATNWSPAGIPGKGDALVISSGSCLVSNYLECAALTVAGGSLKVAEKATSKLEEAVLKVAGDLVISNNASVLVAPVNYYRHGVLTVGGDLSLTNTAQLTISAGPLDNESFTMAGGGGFVTVGRNFSITGSAKVTPNCEVYTGGPIVFTVGGRFTLGEGATIYAVANGFKYCGDRVPAMLAPGAGWSYTIGAGYGGYGVAHNGVNGEKYGSEYAPIHPGSGSGDYGGGHPGGGLIRIHAGVVSLAGTLNADAAATTSTASSASGGGIFVTASGAMDIAASASFLARGGYRCTGLGQPGGGGRIALWRHLSAADLATLVGTGTMRRVARRDRTDAFLAVYPDMAKVVGGENLSGDNAGTFRFCDGRRPGIVIVFR